MHLDLDYHFRDLVFIFEFHYYVFIMGYWRWLWELILRALQQAFGPQMKQRWRIPDITTAQVTFNPVRVGKTDDNQCFLELGRNQAFRQGMILTLVINAMPNGAGTIETIQLVQPNRHRWKASNGNEEVFTSGGEWVLDGGNPYVPGVAIAAGQQAVLFEDHHDTPGQSCAIYILTTTVMTDMLELLTSDDWFRVYVMWRPAHMQGQSVCMGYVDWRWKGRAEATAQADQECRETHAPTQTDFYWKNIPQPNPSSWSRGLWPNYFVRPRWRRQTSDLDWREV